MSAPAVADSSSLRSPLNPPLSPGKGRRLQWGRLYGSAAALAIATAARKAKKLTLVLAEDVQSATRLRDELKFFAGSGLDVLGFPDWETLPYDVFAPLPELISERLATLYRLPSLKQGLLVVPVATLLQRLCPRDYIDTKSLILAKGDLLDIDETRLRLERAGYYGVSQVTAHGEMAVRGSLLDLFPMGSTMPYRIDLLDDEVDSIRTFDPETQRTVDKVDAIELLPAREIPVDEEAITAFRKRWRATFESDPRASLIYREVSEGRFPGGIEYYLPLFFDDSATLFDYLPESCMLIEPEGARDAAQGFLDNVQERFEQRRHDVERPLLAPERVWLDGDELANRLNGLAGVRWQGPELVERRKGFLGFENFATQSPPPLTINARAADPAALLKDYLNKQQRVLFVAESTGRREMLLEGLRGFDIKPKLVDGWQGFVDARMKAALTVAPLEHGLLLPEAGLALVGESQLFGERVRQDRRRRARERGASPYRHRHRRSRHRREAVGSGHRLARSGDAGVSQLRPGP